MTGDHVQAADWYTKAANQNVAWAQYKLGMLYISGQGVPRDYAKAAEW
ncbi:MAG: sel1 repeat family protein, partial [Ferrovum sp.]|nr:sel1 repeat family protein [Ferrovum sp.]